MRKFIFTIALVWLACLLFYRCNNQQLQNATVFYRDFSLFDLSGVDPLRKVDKMQSVEVRYENGLPVFIKYYKSSRTITLKKEDVFFVNGDPVYVYGTSNFHGGLQGKNKEYSFSTSENRDLLYINMSDTIICKSNKVTSLEYYSYTLYLYIRNHNEIVEFISGTDTKNEEGATKEILYLKWHNILVENLRNNPSVIHRKAKIPDL